MAFSGACGSMSAKVIDVKLDGQNNCCMWVHLPQGGGEGTRLLRVVRVGPYT